MYLKVSELVGQSMLQNLEIERSRNIILRTAIELLLHYYLVGIIGFPNKDYMFLKSNNSTIKLAEMEPFVICVLYIMTIH